MIKFSNSILSYSGLLYIAHESYSINRALDSSQDDSMNWSYLWLTKIFKSNLSIIFHYKKWGHLISQETIGLFDNDSIFLDERSLPLDEIIPAKLDKKNKFDSHGGLEKLKATVCLRGDIQSRDNIKSWSLAASSKTSKMFHCWFCTRNGHRFKKRMLIVMDKEYGQFYHKLVKKIRRPLSQKYLYGADFIVKSYGDCQIVFRNEN